MSLPRTRSSMASIHLDLIIDIHFHTHCDRTFLVSSRSPSLYQKQVIEAFDNMPLSSTPLPLPVGGRQDAVRDFCNPADVPFFCTALHRTALHRTALHRTALHCTALYCTGVKWYTSGSDLHIEFLKAFLHRLCQLWSAQHLHKVLQSFQPPLPPRQIIWRTVSLGSEWGGRVENGGTSQHHNGPPHQLIACATIHLISCERHCSGREAIGDTIHNIGLPCLLSSSLHCVWPLRHIISYHITSHAAWVLVLTCSGVLRQYWALRHGAAMQCSAIQFNSIQFNYLHSLT